jgi:hypothetical protein
MAVGKHPPDLAVRRCLYGNVKPKGHGRLSKADLVESHEFEGIDT